MQGAVRDSEVEVVAEREEGREEIPRDHVTGERIKLVTLGSVTSQEKSDTGKCWMQTTAPLD
jgi:hypothetical protein